VVHTPGQSTKDHDNQGPPKRTTSVFVVVSVLILGGLLVAIWRAGGAESNARVIAAVVSLSGVLIASALTFLGVLLKHSLDVRNATLAEEAERRLRLEASIKAIELLTVEKGELAPPIRQAGALFALTSLGQLELAIALLVEIWPQGRLSAKAAVEVINRTLIGGGSDLQEDAAIILERHAEFFTK
jgi:hypothetical protein